jgi:hypothetical protein
VAFKEGAGVLEALFGVSIGFGDAVKRFIEDADDALLFGEWDMRNLKRFYKWEFYSLDRCSSPLGHDQISGVLKPPEKELNGKNFGVKWNNTA